MRYKWPEDTQFEKIVLLPDNRVCPYCGGILHVCDHRSHKYFSLKGPVHLICHLTHCIKADCPGHVRTFSPSSESLYTFPHWLIGWDVFAFIGHRRFSRHWAIPEIREELLETYHVIISHDTIENHIAHYQAMLASRHQDFSQLSKFYEGVSEVVLAIDGLQPEKGHETLYVIREITNKRVWLAEPILSSTAMELEKLIEKAKGLAASLNLKVKLWVSDKQDALLKAIKKVFPRTPHQYCENHFIRDLAKPVLEADSATKVKLRKKIRGLRATEQKMADPANRSEGFSTRELKEEEEQKEAVLGYCSGIRGILSDDQGGPLDPPGLRMAEGIQDMRDSLERCLQAKVGGKGEEGVKDLIGFIDAGFKEVKEEQDALRMYVEDVRAVKDTLDLKTGPVKDRKKQFKNLYKQFFAREDSIYQYMAGLMERFSKGLFVTGDNPDLPRDNLDLERFFKVPKGHERKIHGRRHAGIRIVVEGATLIPTLDAHLLHPRPFLAKDLISYAKAEIPEVQKAALARKKTQDWLDQEDQGLDLSNDWKADISKHLKECETRWKKNTVTDAPH